MTTAADRLGPMVETAQGVLAACGDDVVAAFVFGSVAWGDADDSSDVDLMLLLERDDDFREVRRARVGDLIGDPDATPAFVDIDRISFTRFREAVHQDQWLHRVANSVVLVDDGRFQPLRDHATARLAERDVRAALSHERVAAAAGHGAAAERLIDSDRSLAVLHARMAAEEAASALVLASGNRLSVAHLFDGLLSATGAVGRSELVDSLRDALSVDGGADHAEQGMRSYRLIAGALQDWMSDPGTAQALGPEHLAWAEFTYSPDTYGEVDHKLTALRRAGREAEMVLYVDGLLKVPLRMNTSKVLRLRAGDGPERMSIPEFHVGLRTHPELHRAWVTGLRLDGVAGDVEVATDAARELLGCEDAVLARGGDRDSGHRSTSE